jgi:uncharacterized protein YdaU (DUF1376 family)
MADAKSSASPVHVRKSPAFQFYAADFLSGTNRFTLEQRGAMITLLCDSWEHGPLSLDPAVLARSLGLTKAKFLGIWEIVGRKWKRTDAGYINLKLESVRAERIAFSELQSARAQKRWAKDDAAALPRHMPDGMPDASRSDAGPYAGTMLSKKDQDQELVHPPRSGVLLDLDLSEEPTEPAAGAAFVHMKRRQTADHFRRLAIAHPALKEALYDTPISELSEVLKQAFIDNGETRYDSGVITRTIDAWRAIRWPDHYAQPAMRKGY